MPRTMSTQQLEQQIEELIRKHIAACHTAVAGAVERAFAAAKSEPTRRPRQAKSPSGHARRRTSKEIAALGEQFYSAVCANPGETMTFLASHLGTTARQLAPSVAQLKRAGRVRSVGRRAQMRYFPLIGKGQSNQEAVA
ncbi:MAG: hypothetical protein WBV10_14265 [Exiguobacterium marinum]|uniref:hypothetical protein n=1 Tax=Exiguobacterium marinum TaxID=273528 RepID=UPI003C4868D9